MRINTLLSTIVFLLLSFFCHGQQDLEDPSTEEISQLEIRKSAHLPSFSNKAPSPFNITYHRLELEVDPALRYIKGAITTYFKPEVADIDSISFDISDDLQIDSILYHGTRLQSFDRVTDEVSILLPSSINNGTLDSICLFYQGIPTRSGFGSFVQEYHNGTPIIWTLSEPYGARDWWPCKQSLADKVDSVDIIVTSPALYKTASNGILVENVVSGSSRTMHWRHRYPIAPYLIAIAVTDYTEHSDFIATGTDTIEVLNFLYSEMYDSLKQETSKVTPVMELFINLFGDYPFADEKYGHAQFGWGGGMEHQTMSFMGTFSHSLVAHELAHQWFGNKITCGSWEDIWLNEGFATFLTGLTYETMFEGQYWHSWKAQQIESVVSAPSGSVRVDDTTSISRIFSGRLTYSKGAMLLHMLRWKLGDDVFFDGLRKYINDEALAYGFASTSDLRAHLEAASGQNLKPFFKDWYEENGYPVYDVFWVQEDDYKASITLYQTPSDSVLEENSMSSQFFELPVPIEVYGENQRRQLVLDHQYSGQSFEFNLPFAIDSIVFDPELWLVAKVNRVIRQPIFEADEGLLIYPNPAENSVTIQVEGLDKADAYVDIYSSDGRLMNQTFIPVDDLPLVPHSIDLSGLQSGTYLMEVNGFNRYSGKLIIP